MNSPDHVSAGIVSADMYLPEPVLTAADIAEQSGLPEGLLTEAGRARSEDSRPS